MKASWRLFLKDKKNQRVLLFSVAGLAIILLAFLNFLTYNEFRSGWAFNDPVLRLIQPVDVSGLTFLITYVFCISGIVIAFQTPALVVKLIQAYALMTLLRMITLFMIPLDPPVNIIPLHDALLHATFYSGRDNLRDLFFSGHTTTLFLFAFAFENKKLKATFAVVACVVGALLMLQHVHYSIDVAVAPVVAYGVLWLQKQIAGLLSVPG